MCKIDETERRIFTPATRGLHVKLERTFIGADGVGPKTESKLWNAGIGTWDEFTPDVVGPTTADRITAYIDAAKPRLAAGDSRFFDQTLPTSEQWRLYDDFRDQACFFDIESTGLSKHMDSITCLSCFQNGSVTSLVRGESLTREAVREALDAPLLISFNGAQFDIPFLEAEFGLNIDTPHLDLRYPCKRVGLTGGLKPIETAIGIERDKPDLDGADAVRLWYDHQRGIDGALETLLAYNREDVINLQTVADTTIARLDAQVLPFSP